MKKTDLSNLKQKFTILKMHKIRSEQRHSTRSRRSQPTQMVTTKRLPPTSRLLTTKEPSKNYKAKPYTTTNKPISHKRKSSRTKSTKTSKRSGSRKTSLRASRLSKMTSRINKRILRNTKRMFKLLSKQKRPNSPVSKQISTLNLRHKKII